MPLQTSTQGAFEPSELTKVGRLLSAAQFSDDPEDRLYALDELCKLLKTRGLQLVNLIRMPGETPERAPTSRLQVELPPCTDWRTILTMAQNHPDCQSEWEVEFCEDMLSEWIGAPTEKQQVSIDGIAGKLRHRGADV